MASLPRAHLHGRSGLVFISQPRQSFGAAGSRTTSHGFARHTKQPGECSGRFGRRDKFGSDARSRRPGRTGGNPVGTNPEITAALNAGNPKQINFIKPEAGMRINENGELVNAWGTPFFFHQLSSSETEIHSAGPDKIMWTSNDLVAR